MHDLLHINLKSLIIWVMVDFGFEYIYFVPLTSQLLWLLFLTIGLWFEKKLMVFLTSVIPFRYQIQFYRKTQWMQKIIRCHIQSRRRELSPHLSPRYQLSYCADYHRLTTPSWDYFYCKIQNLLFLGSFDVDDEDNFDVWHLSTFYFGLIWAIPISEKLAGLFNYP